MLVERLTGGLRDPARSGPVTGVYARLEASHGDEVLPFLAVWIHIGTVQSAHGHVTELVAQHFFQTSGSVVAKIGAKRDASGRGTAASQGTA